MTIFSSVFWKNRSLRKIAFEIFWPLACPNIRRFRCCLCIICQCLVWVKSKHCMMYSSVCLYPSRYALLLQGPLFIKVGKILEGFSFSLIFDCLHYSTDNFLVILWRWDENSFRNFAAFVSLLRNLEHLSFVVGFQHVEKNLGRSS